MRDCCPNSILYVRLLRPYLSGRKFRIALGKAKSKFCGIQAGVPLGSILRPLLYLLFTADVSKIKGTTLAMFADNTAIHAVINTHVEDNYMLQDALEKTALWMRLWKVKLNESKSVQVTYTLRPIDIYLGYLL